jgi:hypothetical protein
VRWGRDRVLCVIIAAPITCKSPIARHYHMFPCQSEPSPHQWVVQVQGLPLFPVHPLHRRSSPSLACEPRESNRFPCTPITHIHALHISTKPHRTISLSYPSILTHSLLPPPDIYIDVLLLERSDRFLCLSISPRRISG